jgi:hypothetical protein
MWLARLRIVAGAPLAGTRATLAPARLENLELADLQAADLIDALVQSCTGGRTEPFNHETALNLGAPAPAGPCGTTGPRRAALSKACPAECPSPSMSAGTRVFGESGNGAACPAPAILARAQRRDVRPNIWASRRSDSGLPACTLSRYAATAASSTAPASSASASRCPVARMGDCPDRAEAGPAVPASLAAARSAATVRAAMGITALP